MRILTPRYTGSRSGSAATSLVVVARGDCNGATTARHFTIPHWSNRLDCVSSRASPARG